MLGVGVSTIRPTSPARLTALAPDGGDEGPFADWPTDDRIVTYCGPHHLSTARGASLLESGYEQVYAIDEGFVPWLEGEGFSLLTKLDHV